MLWEKRKSEHVAKSRFEVNNEKTGILCEFFQSSQLTFTCSNSSIENEKKV